MIRKLEILGMAIVAVLAPSAVAATAASAEGKITCEEYPCMLTGESPIGNSTLTTEAGSLECKGHAAATLTEASSEVAVTETLTECKSFGFLNATVNMNGCTSLSTTPKHLGTSDGGQTHEWTSTGHLKCPTGKVIEVIAGTCKVTIGTQSPGGHGIITSTTTPTPDDLDIQGTATGINYTVVTDGFGCPFSGTGAKTGATIISHSAVTARAAVSGGTPQNVHVG